MEDPYGVPTARARICFFCVRVSWHGYLGERGVGEEREHTRTAGYVSRYCWWWSEGLSVVSPSFVEVVASRRSA